MNLTSEKQQRLNKVKIALKEEGQLKKANNKDEYLRNYVL